MSFLLGRAPGAAGATTLLAVGGGRRGLHASLPAASRMIPLSVKPSRRTLDKQFAKEQKLRLKLGSRYRELARSLARPAAPDPVARLDALFATAPSADRPAAQAGKAARGAAAPAPQQPLPIVPGDVEATLRQAEARRQGVDAAASDVDADPPAAGAAAAAATAGSLRTLPTMREATAAAGTIVIQSQTTLAVQAETVPPSVPAVLKRPTDRAVAAALGTPSVPTVQVAGPYYAHGLTAEDARLVFQTLPAATQDAHRTQVPGAVTPAMQTEMVRRILALENGTGRDIRRFNIRRCVDLFGAGPTDTGATHVQVAVLSAKIFSKKRHLAQYPGDVYAKQALEVAQSRRLRLLRYLRRTDLPLYVKTCYQVGINPDRVRISPQ